MLPEDFDGMEEDVALVSDAESSSSSTLSGSPGEEGFRAILERVKEKFRGKPLENSRKPELLTDKVGFDIHAIL